MPISSFILAAALLVAEHAPAPAQDHPAARTQPTDNNPAAGSSEADIVITARTAEALDTFIEQVTQARQGRQIARWDRRICIRTLGLDAAHNSYVVSGIAHVAKTLKIGISPSPCRGDVVVIFTNDADGFADAIIKRYPKLFQDIDSGIHALREQRDELRASRPVRWINASLTGPRSGGAFDDTTNHLFTATRLVQPTRQYAVRSMAIVDLTSMTGLSWAQLVDYLAMVCLANPSMSAKFDSHSILSMFQLRDRGAKPPSGLTSDDRAVLHALYTVGVGAEADAQRDQIKAAMLGNKQRP